MDLAFTTQTVDDTSVLVVSGEVDLASVPRLRSVLADFVSTGKPSLVIDLSQVFFIDSTGLGALVGARRRIVETGGDLTLVVPQAPMQRLFAVTGLDRVFRIVDSVIDGSEG